MVPMAHLLTLCVIIASCDCGGDDGGADAGVDASLDSGADAGADGGDDAAVDAGADAGPGLIVRSDERAACADRIELRNLYFGDLHVHTRFSFDAASYDIRTGPRDAYRFAKGEPIGLPPYDASGQPTRRVMLDRPLDFAAVTDHAELMAATSLCTDATSPAYESRTCRSYRENGNPNLGFGDFFESIGLVIPQPVRLCRGDPALCAEELSNVWLETIDAAEEHDDKTATCGFTAFIGYEWTGSAGGGGVNIHRNVIFRGGTVLGRPLSYVDASKPDRLWDALEAICTSSGTACDVLAIPHNSNVSLGNMFNPLTEEREPYDAEFARRRAALEPLVEIYQHKGASECVTNVGDPLASEDELCNFEIFYERQCTGPGDPTPECVALCDGTGGSSFLTGSTCVSPGDYVRGGLRTGLAEYVRIGVNPFQLGFIASTDTHGSLAGAVDEASWPGHTGDFDDEPEEQLRQPMAVGISVRTSSPGGLAAVWSEENSRPALFDAMRRRETYGTSGTRLAVRFFGGWEYPDDICAQIDNARTGYDGGVPMGGELPERGAAAAPVFFVSALRDAMSAPLQRIQIVKGSVDPETGATTEEVFEIAGEPDNGASVDFATCTPTNPGTDFGSLCGRWADPTFDPAHPAFYYARVLENPTCRWSQRLCVEESVDCATPPEGPLAACCDGSLPRAIQERAWTSPIWYLP